MCFKSSDDDGFYVKLNVVCDTGRHTGYIRSVRPNVVLYYALTRTRTNINDNTGVL